MEVNVLGRGCVKCHLTEEIVKLAVAEAGAEIQVEMVTDTTEIAAYGVFVTPAVVVDGEVKLAGEIPTKEQIKSWPS